MYMHRFSWKLLAIFLTLPVFLLWASHASTQATTADPPFIDTSEETKIETDTPRIWPHLEISATISPAPAVGQTAIVQIEVTSAVDEERVAISTQMSPQISLTAGETSWAGPVQANESYIHEFSITVQEAGQWVIYMTAVAGSTAWDVEQLHINSTAGTAEVVPSHEYKVFQDKEAWPGDPAELVPHQFPKHPEPANPIDGSNRLLLAPVTVEGNITFEFEYEDCLPTWPGIPPGTCPGVILDSKSLRNAQVWLYDRATGGEDHYLATTTTDDTGFYTFTVENTDPDGDGTGIDPLVTIFPAGPEGNEKVYIVDSGGTEYFVSAAAPDDDLIDGSVYSFDYDIPLQLGQIPAGQVMYIFDQIANEAYTFLQNSVGWSNNEVIKVNYPQSCLWGMTPDDSCYLGAVDGISIYNIHGRMADVIIHEYGHFVLSRYLGDTAVINACAPGYAHDLWTPTVRPACAWSEGWANFLEMAVQNDPDYIGADLETPHTNHLPPAGEEPARWEGVVAATLWDIFDPAGTEGGGFVDPLADGFNGPANNGIWHFSTQLPLGSRVHTIQEFFDRWTENRSSVPDDLTAVCDMMAEHRFLFYALTLDVSPPNSGLILAEPPLHCPGGTFLQDTFMQLTAVPEAGFIFSQWSGDVSGSEPYQSLSFTTNITIVAEFDYFPTPTPPATNTPIPTPTSTPTPDYMIRVSSGSGGHSPAISNDGRYLAYFGAGGDIFRFDRSTDTAPVLVAPAGGAGTGIDISDDGRYIAYSALGPVHYDVFLYDHNTGSTQNLTNHPSDPAVLNKLHWDVQVVQTSGSVLVGYTMYTGYTNQTSAYTIWLYNSAQGTATEINPPIGSGVRRLRDISDDGDEFLLRSTNALYVVTSSGQIVQTLTPPITTVAITGAGFSADGRYVVYRAHQQVCTPTCTYNSYVYWHDRVNNVTEEINMNGPEGPITDIPVRVSNNDRYVFYPVYTNNLYRYDRANDQLLQVSLSVNGTNPNGAFFNLESSGDGRFITFSTTASNLVFNDTNNSEDVFLADMAYWDDSPLSTPTPGSGTGTPPTTPGTPSATITPGGPTLTPTPGPICFVVVLLASHDAPRVAAVHQPTSTLGQITKPARQFVGKMMQTADMLTLLYRLRDEVMNQSETGLFYTDLYYTHTDELTSLVQADPNLFQEAHDALLLFQPHLADLLDGNGHNVVITAAEVQAVQTVLDHFVAAGSPALQQAIAAERARWPLEQFIGKTPADVWDSLNSNLLQNGDFEQGLPPWSAQNPGDVTITNDAYTGSNAVRLGSDSRTGQHLLGIQPGETYTLRGWARKGGSQWSGIGLAFYDANNAQLIEKTNKLRTIF